MSTPVSVEVLKKAVGHTYPDQPVRVFVVLSFVVLKAHFSLTALVKYGFDCPMLIPGLLGCMEQARLVDLCCWDWGKGE